MSQHEIATLIFVVGGILSFINSILLYALWRHWKVEKVWEDMHESLQERRIRTIEMLTTFGFTYAVAEVKDINIPCNEMKEGELIVQVIGSSTYHKDVFIRLNFTNNDFARKQSLNTQAEYLKDYLLHIERLEQWELKPWRSVNVKGKIIGNMWMDLRKDIPKPLPTLSYRCEDGE